MHKIFLFIFFSASLFAQHKANTEKLKNDFNNNLSKQNTAVFEENKGQMKDQNWKPRPDVLFYGKSEGMNYYIQNNGMSYQLSRVDSWKEEEGIKGMPDSKNKRKMPDQMSSYRVDAEWLCNNENYTIEKGNELPGYNNYYNVPEGVEPALFVKQYEAVTLKNLWNGIDIHYYSSEGFLETDYLVAPGADYRQIQMEIKGADLSIDAEGYLVMKTPFGEIREGKLKVYQENKLIDANWKLIQKGDKIWQVSFDIPDFNPALAMRIDPVVRVWGTYYGGSEQDEGLSCSVDNSGNVYLAGLSMSQNNISFGGHQNTNGSNNYDAFLVKFNAIGQRIWGTYYGGNNFDYANSCKNDTSGNIYITGPTKSTNGIALNGHQDTIGGGSGDAFLVKFNTLGQRIWGTYIGGNGYDEGYSCSIDYLGNIIVAGGTNSTSNISLGGHQNSSSISTNQGYWDAFLVKFNANGQKIWGTYYGGIGGEYGSACITDINNNIFLTGQTTSDSAIAYNGHQNNFGGSRDAFLVKFNSNGVRQWGTYYGGNGQDYGYSCAADPSGNVYLAGTTGSFDSISYNGHQNNFSGSMDAFLVKFNGNGQREWGTYIGNGGADGGFSCATDRWGNVYIAGNDYSQGSIFYNGIIDSVISSGFIIKLSGSGQRIWGSYVGDSLVSCAINYVGDIFVTGRTNNWFPNSIIGFNGHQDTIGGGYSDAFLMKISQPKISGYVWNDLNSNCIVEQTEYGIINALPLLIQPGNIVTQSNNGIWVLDSLAAGTYTITVDTTNSNWIPTCPITQTFTVVNPDSIMQGPNFGFISAFLCASPNIDIIMPEMRRGFSDEMIYVQACNETAAGILDSAYTIVQLPSQISVQSASLPYTSLLNNRYRFELGAITPGQCVNFTINSTVSTAAENWQTLCMSAELFPQADCVFDSIPTPYDESPSGSVTPCTLPWDRSSLRVEGECIGDSVRFVIYNTGSFGGGDMDCFAPVRIYVDGQWVMLDSIRIVGGDSVVFMFAGTGGTIRLEADQHPLHPGNSHPNANVENCGNGTWTPGIINTMPQNDADPFIDIYCGQVTAPYDPNDKTGFPLGVGTNHNIRQNQQIEYLVRFQNIGTDTAVNVVIRDTLTTDLNIFTVQSGVASHPYEFRMYGPRILEWKFNNIMLPDSNTNEPASNGFVKFTVAQNPDLAFGTVIENSAAIYFDFEAPVITNTYFHTIHDFSINVSVERIEGADKYVNVKVIPNPFRNQATLQLEGLENTDNLELEIFNLSGQRIQYLNNSQNGQFELSRGEMSQGIYFFSIRQNGKVVARGKMVVE